MKNLAVFLGLLCLASWATADLVEITPETRITQIIDDLQDEIAELVPVDNRERFYEQYYDAYSVLDGLNIMELLNMLGKPQADNSTCHTVNNLMGIGRTLLTSKEILVGLLGSVCKDSASLSKRTCTGLLDRFADPILWLFKNTKLTNPEISAVLVGHGCMKFLGEPVNDKMIKWELPLPPKKEFKPQPHPAGKHKKILHLTDIHLDLWYTPNSVASCNEPLCCRSTSIDYSNKSITAGSWAQVAGACDIPQHFVMDSLKQIAARHPDLDAVFWTGDNVPHDVWNTTEQINLRHIHTVTGGVVVAFNNIPVFPVLGNHEVHPINMYVPEAVTEKDANHSSKWLYNTLATDYWARWLDTPEIKKTFTKGGYYSKMHTPNWKIIVLNSNIAQKQNFWILYDPVDPDGQLAWLIKELDHAESIGAYVSILGHVPPRYENYDAWVHNYIRIMDRYSHVITGTYYGHTHKDEVTVLYNEKKKPVSVVYISGSLTTFSDLNPNYAIFEMDSRGAPVDSTTYITDMDKDNQRLAHNASATPVWRQEYRPRHAYRLSDMTPHAWDNFLTRAEHDVDLASLYYNHYHRYSKEYNGGHPKSIDELKDMMVHIKRYSPFMHMEKDNNSENTD